jgi:hypothetical protein
MKKNRFVSALAILGAFVGFPCAVLAQPLTFSSANLATGSGPAMVVPADVNNDGYVDLVCANFGFRLGNAFGSGGGTGTTLSVFTNGGGGNLGLSATLTVGLEPAGIAAADVNGDGAVDLISANVGDNTLTVLTNDGKGGFTLAGTFPVGHAPTFVAAADVNGDGSVDLISANYGDSTLTVLTNNGHGSFKLSATLAVGSEPNCIAAVDINGDGKVDLVCANSGDNTLQMLTNNGRGVFTRSATVGVVAGAAWVIGTDVDHDGTVDLVAASAVALGSTLTVLTNDGRGHFSLKSTTSVSGSAGMVVAADMNSDGKVDLICPNNGNGIQGSATVLTNDGHGNFTVNTTIPIGIAGTENHPNFVTTADFSGDGNPDIAVSCYGAATITELTQINATPRPVITIINPASDAVIRTADSFEIDTSVLSPTEIEVVLYYLGTNILTASTNPPYNVQIHAGAIPAGTHALQAVAVDSAGQDGWSAEVQINVTSGSAVGPPPVVSITTPANGASYLTTENIVIQTTTSSAVSRVELYVDGQLLEQAVSTPYSFLIAAGALSPGSHTLQAVAVNSQNASGSSSVVNITVDTPGTIDFDALNTSAGAVGGTLLVNYLAGYGVTLADVTAGTTMEAVNTNSLTGSVQVDVPSSPNFFTQAGLDQPVSFTLRFAKPLQSFGFTRVGLSAQSGLVSHPQWTATAFDSNGTELSSVTEALILSSSPVAERNFVLPGDGIASVRFDSDSQQTAAFSAVLLDNLVLNYNPVAPMLSVALSVTSPPTNNIVAPATITLTANVTDLLSSSYYVSFFAGPSLLGTVSGSPYQLTLTGVLPGNYDLQASAVDVSGLAVESQVVPITVQTEPDSTVVNFDALNASREPVEGTILKDYLAGFGVSVASLSPGTELAVESQQNIAGGAAVLAASPPNLLTQIGSNGPVQFTLSFAPLLSQFGFTRPELLANPFVSHPAWQVTALDGAGTVVGQVGEGQIDSATNVGAREFSLSSAGGPGIAEVEFSSEGSGLTTFNAMLVDDLVLTTNKSAFPPAVAITRPITGQVLAAPPALTVTAAASDAAGIAEVSFYSSGTFIGAATASPYTISWPNPGIGNHALRAIASNVLGLAWLSSVVHIVIEPSAYQFGISSQPASQTVAAGASVTFTVVTTGTNGVGYQWYYNGAPISGQTSDTLVLRPPIQDDNAGTYTVAATANGVTMNSDGAVLTVVDPPTFTTQPQGQTVAAGADVTLTAAAAGEGPFTWRWLLDGTSIPGATNSVYSIVAAEPLRSGNYQVVVANLAASALSAVASVIVETATTIPETNDNFADRASINPLLGPVSDSNQLATVQAGEPLPDGLPGGKSIWFTWHATFTGTLSLTTEGSDFETLLAVYTGTELSKLKAVAGDEDSGGFLTSLVTFNVTEGTDYQIDVDGFQGASGRVVLGLPAGTGYRILNPSSGDSVPVIVRGPASKAVAPNASAVLSVQASSATKTTYQWYFQGAPIAGATSSSFVISHVQAGSVGLCDVVVANAAGSAQSEPANLQIGVNQGGPVTSTENKFVDSTDPASPKDLAYDLRPLVLGGDTRGVSIAQTFSTVGATREPGEPAPCGQIGGASQWFLYTAPESGMMQVNTDGSSFNTLLGVYTGSGTSFSSLTETGCGYTTNYVTEGQPSVVLPSVAKGTAFYILVDGYQGASGLVQLQIGLGQTLSFRSLPPSQLMTAGNNATFNVTAVGSTPFSYQWQLNGINVPGATTSTCKVTNAQEHAVGNYTVIVSNALGAVTSSPPAVLTLQFAPDIVSGPSNQTVTLGQSAKFTVTALGVNVKTNPFVCQWYFNKAPLPKATSLSLSFPVTRLTNGGSYYLVISNTYGSVTSSAAMLTFVDKTVSQSPAQAESLLNSTGALASTAPGTYSGLFYPATGATQASAGFFTATIASRGVGAFSANLLLDGGSYPFTGRFDPSGDAQSIVPRAGKASVTASLHLDVDPADGQMTGMISNGDWRSILKASRAVFNAASNPAPVCAGQFALVIPSGANTPVGYLTLTNTAGGTALVTGTLADGANIIRAAPMVKGAAIPLYVPLYSGKGLFLGWITFTNWPAQTNVADAFWIKPGSTNVTGVLIVK